MSDQFDFSVDKGPVECLGKTFQNDDERRNYFTELLREKLKDPEFRSIEGFPIGEDEDILALSDPPYYTACPNPWMGEFIEQWEQEKPAKPEGYKYHREPFAADVSEGKYDPIYKMHPYHTKVPHKAIMHYLLHFTEPGDIVFDSFAGTGMTGIAAKMCGDKEVVQSLGYRVDNDGTVLLKKSDDEGNSSWVSFSKLGERRAMLNDLSPAASYIAYSFNTPQNNIVQFEKEINEILNTVEDECNWMYETKHQENNVGIIDSVVWSDVFICPECSSEHIFWETAVDIENGNVLKEFSCPECNALLTKEKLERSWTTFHDPTINETVKFVKQVPVEIKYSYEGRKYSKKPDVDDIELLKKIEQIGADSGITPVKIPNGDKTGEALRLGFTHVHHLYTTRNFNALAVFKRNSKKSNYWQLLTKVAFRITKRYGLTYQSGTWGAGGGPQNGTYYIPSLIKELNIIRMLRKSINNIVLYKYIEKTCISTQSASNVNVNDNSCDYIFIDPPFGSNLNYSELNLVWETWLGCQTNIAEEAIENKTQKKASTEYRKIMTTCFKEAYRVLKPGRWITVEFSNTKAIVWNNIQTAITDAGFVIANISALDKKKGSFNAQTNPTSVKQDLIFSAYKPNGGFEDRFISEANSEDGIWDFVGTHLKYLAVIKKSGTNLVPIPERDPRILYDQLISYYVRKGYNIPISSQEFQKGLAERFELRDGMFFLHDQVVEYDKARAKASGQIQLSLFVDDEKSAIDWLRDYLKRKPGTYSDINPNFMQQMSANSWKSGEKQPELQDLLNLSFLRYDGLDDVPSQIHSYLSTNFKDLRNLDKSDELLKAKAKDRWYVPDPNKEADLEKVRLKSLLKEYEGYKEGKGKLKEVRREALRTGFKQDYQNKNFNNIMLIAKRLKPEIIDEDETLLMYFDYASMVVED